MDSSQVVLAKTTGVFKRYLLVSSTTSHVAQSYQKLFKIFQLPSQRECTLVNMQMQHLGPQSVMNMKVS